MDFSRLEEQFLEILNEELVPAKGCTEPIAIAFAGAKAREVLVSKSQLNDILGKNES